MGVENVSEAAVALFSLWFCGLLVLSAYRFLRHAGSNLSRGRRIGDWLFEPLEFDQLPAKTLVHFEAYTSEIRALGFELIRDYRLRRHPGPVFARYFLAADRRVFGEISDYLGQRSYGFFSVFDNGTYLETTSAGSPYELPKARLLMLHSHPGASIADLYAEHLEHVHAYADLNGTGAVELGPDDLDAAANYGRRLVHAHVCWWRFGRVRAPDFIHRSPVA